MIDGYEWIDDDGNRYWLDENGGPDFDDPVIMFHDWIGSHGVSSDEAIDLEKR